MLKRDKLEKGGGSLQELRDITCAMEVKKKKKNGKCRIMNLGTISTPTKEFFSFCKVT